MRVALPPKDQQDSPKEPYSFSLPRWMAERLDQLAKAGGYRSRSEYLTELLRLHFREDAGEGQNSPTSKKR